VEQIYADGGKTEEDDRPQNQGVDEEGQRYDHRIHERIAAADGTAARPNRTLL
jgi:hypothetical protein